MAQGDLEKALKGCQEAEAPAAEAALRELEKARTNYQSAEAVSCCWPLRTCRHSTRWGATSHQTLQYICVMKGLVAVSQS